jgi:hypothetical protein
MIIMCQQKFESKINPKPDPCSVKHIDPKAVNKYESDKKAYETIEKLAAIDHDQWHFWSQSIMRDLDELVTALNDVDNRMLEANIGYGNSSAHIRVINLIRKHNERNDRWQKQWCKYQNLPEEVKESDRIWAKKSYKALTEKK